MAALMDIQKLKSPDVENGGSLFDPDCEHSDMASLTSKVYCFSLLPLASSSFVQFFFHFLVCLFFNLSFIADKYKFENGVNSAEQLQNLC